MGPLGASDDIHVKKGVAVVVCNPCIKTLVKVLLNGSAIFETISSLCRRDPHVRIVEKPVSFPVLGLMYRVINSCTEFTDRFDDLIGGLMPDERSRALVIDSKVIADGAFEFERAAVRAALDLALAQQREPAGG